MSDDALDEMMTWDSQCWFPPIELVTLVAAGVLPQDAYVLDVGCGAGIEAIYLARMGWKVFGVDIDRTLIPAARAMAARHRVEAKFSLGDIRNGREGLPESWPKRFDVVVDRLCVNNIVHGDDFDREKYFEVMAALMNGGGVLVVRDRGSQDEAEKTFRRKLFEEIDLEEFLPDSARKDFELLPGGRIVNVRLVGDDTPDWNRIDAMIPVRGELAILRRKPINKRRRAR